MLDSTKIALYASSPAAFRKDLMVDVDGVIVPLGKVMDPWQRDDFAALDNGMLAVVGKKPRGIVKLRAYLERGRGHSKTTDLAIIVVWLLAFANRPLRGYCFAADKEQAALLHNAIALLVRVNPWLAEVLTVESNRIVNKASGHPGSGSTLEISASNIGSSYGILPDFIIADELTHWPENASGLWTSLISSAAKRKNCLFVVIANAGFQGGWSWGVREAIRSDDSWYFSRLEGPQASWLLRSGVLEEQQRLLPPMAYARLWGNEWASGGGDALSEADILAAFRDDLEPMPQKLEGWECVAGLDLGVSRDFSAIVVVGIRKHDSWDKSIQDHGRIRLLYTKSFRPPKGGKVNLQAIEDALKVLHKTYEFQAVNYDPWQAEHMSQRLILSNIPMVEVPPTGQNLQRQASTLIEAFNDRRLDFYPEPTLLAEIRKLRCVEKSYGFKLVAPSGNAATGHSDMASALALALLAASEAAGKKRHLLAVYSDGWQPSLGQTLQTYERSKREDELERKRLQSMEWNDRQEKLKELLGGIRRPY